jgi:hypothetical protein
VFAQNFTAEATGAVSPWEALVILASTALFEEWDVVYDK